MSHRPPQVSVRRLYRLMFLAACGCTPAGPSADVGPADASSSDAHSLDAATVDGPSLDTGGADRAVGDRPATADRPSGLGSCAEIAAADCFSSYDCAADEACLNVGEPDAPVPCCVVATRGAGGAGVPCDPEQGEYDCESAICIDSGGDALCSTTCAETDDCPATMQRCVTIAFSGSPDRWCFPD